MKTQSLAILCLGALALSPTLASCDSEARLAENITGTWAATPEKLIDSDAMSATAIRIIQFNPDADNNKGGDLQMTALVSITNATSSLTKFSDAISSIPFFWRLCSFSIRPNISLSFSMKI